MRASAKRSPAGWDLPPRRSVARVAETLEFGVFIPQGWRFDLVGIDTADMVRAGTVDYVLVIGVEKLSDFTDKHDRGSAFIFGDGAGAAWLHAHGEVLDQVVEGDSATYEVRLSPKEYERFLSR